MTNDQRYFLVFGSDRPGSLTLRQSLRASHREWLREHPGHAVEVIHAGPTLDEAGEMNGTLLILRAEQLQRVRDFVGADPYSTGGLFAEVTIRPWDWLMGKPVET